MASKQIGLLKCNAVKVWDWRSIMVSVYLDFISLVLNGDHHLCCFFEKLVAP